MVYQNVLGIQGYGLEGYPKHSLANTGCKHFSAFDGPMNWSENGLGLCPLFNDSLCKDDRFTKTGSGQVLGWHP
jgi:hypothetical protein